MRTKAQPSKSSKAPVSERRIKAAPKTATRLAGQEAPETMRASVAERSVSAEQRYLHQHHHLAALGVVGSLESDDNPIRSCLEALAEDLHVLRCSLTSEWDVAFLENSLGRMIARARAIADLNDELTS